MEVLTEDDKVTVGPGEGEGRMLGQSRRLPLTKLITTQLSIPSNSRWNFTEMAGNNFLRKDATWNLFWMNFSWERMKTISEGSAPIKLSASVTYCWMAGMLIFR